MTRSMDQEIYFWDHQASSTKTYLVNLIHHLKNKWIHKSKHIYNYKVPINHNQLGSQSYLIISMESAKYLSTLLLERRLTKHMIFILMNPHPMSIDLFDVDILSFTCTHTHTHARAETLFSRSNFSRIWHTWDVRECQAHQTRACRSMTWQ